MDSETVVGRGLRTQRRHNRLRPEIAALPGRSAQKSRTARQRVRLLDPYGADQCLPTWLPITRTHYRSARRRSPSAQYSSAR